MTLDQRVWATFESSFFSLDGNIYTVENLTQYLLWYARNKTDRGELLNDEDMQVIALIKEKITQIAPQKIVTLPEGERSRPLCITLNRSQRQLLDKAEADGLIRYVAERQGYVPMRGRDHRLVAYLCGCIFCHDYTDADGIWMSGGNMECEADIDLLMGFSVGMTRRSGRSQGQGKSPRGHGRVDRLMDRG